MTGLFLAICLRFSPNLEEKKIPLGPRTDTDLTDTNLLQNQVRDSLAYHKNTWGFRHDIQWQVGLTKYPSLLLVSSLIDVD